VEVKVDQIRHAEPTCTDVVHRLCTANFRACGPTIFGIRVALTAVSARGITVER
jgi:hypothetical protein